MSSWRWISRVALVLCLGAPSVACREEKKKTPETPAQPGASEDSGSPPARDSGQVTPRADGGGSVPNVPGADGGSGTDGDTSAAIVSGDSVFFVGNSFFGSWDRILPDWVAAVGRAVEPPIEIKTGSHIVPGNQKLSWFLQQADSKNALKSKKYKVFVIQPEEREPADDTNGFKQGVRDWNKAIVAAGGKTMLFMTWDLPNESDSDFFERLEKAYLEIGEELDIPVIPVGTIYDDCNKAPFPGQKVGSYWTTGGELHQTETGSAINAYATFGMLTGRNPHGVPIDAPANTNSPEMLTYLSDKSWARVLPLVRVSQ